MAWKRWAIAAVATGILVFALVNIGCEQSAPSPQPNVLADFTCDVEEAAVGSPISFIDISSGSVDEWLWDFGDGTSSTSQDPTHSYDSPGTYTVARTVRSGTATDAEIKPGYITATAAGQIPDYVTDSVRALYQWVGTAEGSAILEQVPCYCGCGGLGHRHTRDCYWTDEGEFDGHAVNCGSCLAEAMTAKEMHEQGSDICAIRKAIDLQYVAQADIATDTPMPEGCEA